MTQLFKTTWQPHEKQELHSLYENLGAAAARHRDQARRLSLQSKISSGVIVLMALLTPVFICVMFAGRQAVIGNNPIMEAGVLSCSSIMLAVLMWQRYSSSNGLKASAACHAVAADGYQGLLQAVGRAVVRQRKHEESIQPRPLIPFSVLFDVLQRRCHVLKRISPDILRRSAGLLGPALGNSVEPYQDF